MRPPLIWSTGELERYTELGAQHLIFGVGAPFDLDAALAAKEASAP